MFLYEMIIKLKKTAFSSARERIQQKQKWQIMLRMRSPIRNCIRRKVILIRYARQISAAAEHFFSSTISNVKKKEDPALRYGYCVGIREWIYITNGSESPNTSLRNRINIIFRHFDFRQMLTR